MTDFSGQNIWARGDTLKQNRKGMQGKDAVGYKIIQEEAKCQKSQRERELTRRIMKRPEFVPS